MRMSVVQKYIAHLFYQISSARRTRASVARVMKRSGAAIVRLATLALRVS